MNAVSIHASIHPAVVSAKALHPVTVFSDPRKCPSPQQLQNHYQGQLNTEQLELLEKGSPVSHHQRVQGPCWHLAHGWRLYSTQSGMHILCYDPELMPSSLFSGPSHGRVCKFIRADDPLSAARQTAIQMAQVCAAKIAKEDELRIQAYLRKSDHSQMPFDHKRAPIDLGRGWVFYWLNWGQKQTVLKYPMPSRWQNLLAKLGLKNQPEPIEHVIWQPTKNTHLLCYRKEFCHQPDKAVNCLIHVDDDASESEAIAQAKFTADAFVSRWGATDLASRN